jgi:hypothetical protein
MDYSALRLPIVHRRKGVAPMSPNDVLGWGAAALVFSTFYARQMTLLRMLAIASNIGFVAYGYLNHLWPVVGLHVAMLPLNVIRLREILRARARVEKTATRPMAILPVAAVGGTHKRERAGGFEPPAPPDTRLTSVERRQTVRSIAKERVLEPYRAAS